MSDYEFSRAVMQRIRDEYEASGLTLDEFGKLMGYEASPRSSAWQFLRYTTDPRLSMLAKAVDALGMTFEEALCPESIDRTGSRID